MWPLTFWCLEYGISLHPLTPWTVPHVFYSRTSLIQSTRIINLIFFWAEEENYLSVWGQKGDMKGLTFILTGSLFQPHALPLCSVPGTPIKPLWGFAELTGLFCVCVWLFPLWPYTSAFFPCWVSYFSSSCFLSSRFLSTSPHLLPFPALFSLSLCIYTFMIPS